MMETKTASKKMLNRLPLYLNYIRALPEDVSHISATTMAKSLGLGDVQVRKDLAYVSGAGRQKVGRSRQALIEDIENYLEVATKTGAVVVGVGNLGHALLEYGGFSEFGIHVIAGFDTQPTGKWSKTGKNIYPMGRLRSFCKNYQVSIGIITVPAECAQDVCDQLVDCGITAIWNFAPTTLTVPEHVTVQNENLALALTSLRLQSMNR
jgi:redox-sensing transcriptional repressor